jgi:hypothetical protein
MVLTISGHLGSLLLVDKRESSNNNNNNIIDVNGERVVEFEFHIKALKDSELPLITVLFNLSFLI